MSIKGVENSALSTYESEEEKTDSETSVSKEARKKLTPELKQELSKITGALELVEYLKKAIKHHKKKYKRLKLQIKRLTTSRSSVSVQTQTVSTDFNPSCLSEDLRTCDVGSKIISAEEVKEVAELATQNSGFIYEQSSGMYYDCNTGYYYNAEYGLYYDGNTGTYMQYNQDTNTYEFHSQVSTTVQQGDEPQNNRHLIQRKRHKKKSKTKGEEQRNNNNNNKRLRRSENELEEGELTSRSSLSNSEDEPSEYTEDEEEENDSLNSSDITKQWPPCMRIIVDETSVSSIKTGSLYIITCDGGTLGREGSDHSILIPDINISKHHLKFTFDQEGSKYLVVDLGSRNGTVLNGKRMSGSKRESEPLEIVHGSRIQVGSTVLLCHIHEGTQTCGHCEPGLIQQTNESAVVKLNRNNNSKQDKHKEELQQLRKKYGVNCADENSVKVGKGYKDRAQLRRDVVGSQNPYEKTQVASLDESISSKNKGFKLLEKMGWKEGDALGKDGQGLSEPVALVSNQGNAGIGYENAVINVTQLSSSVPVKANNSKHIWKKAQERFDNLSEYSEKFED